METTNIKPTDEKLYDLVTDEKLYDLVNEIRQVNKKIKKEAEYMAFICQTLENNMHETFDILTQSNVTHLWFFKNEMEQIKQKYNDLIKKISELTTEVKEEYGF